MERDQLSEVAFIEYSVSFAYNKRILEDLSMKRKRKGRKISMLKFSYVSPQWACGLYYGFSARAMQKPGEIRDCFAALVGRSVSCPGPWAPTWDRA